MTIKSDQELMKLLKVTEIRHLIAHTNLGELTLMLRKGDTDYTLCLDAVPLKSSLDTYDVNLCMEILFPVKKIDTVSFYAFPPLEVSNEKPHLVIKKTSAIGPTTLPKTTNKKK